jgi:hypothetical protein
LYFQSPYLPGETCFQKVGSSAVEGTSQAILGSSDQWNVPASLSLFLKSGKIPPLLYKGKGPKYRPFRDFRSVPSAYWPWAQISNYGRASTTGLGHRSQITEGPLLPALGTDLKSWKGLYSGPSPMHSNHLHFLPTYLRYLPTYIVGT